MNRLNELMQENSLTNEELSFQTDIAKNTISKLRNEDFNCKIFTIKKLTEFFNVSFDYFLGYGNQNTNIEKLIKIITNEIRRCYYGNL